MKFASRGGRRRKGGSNIGGVKMGFTSKKAGGLSDADRLDVIVNYCENIDQCRHDMISEYFGEKDEIINDNNKGKGSKGSIGSRGSGARGCHDMCNLCATQNIIAINLAKKK